MQDLIDYEMEETGDEEKIDLLDKALQEGATLSGSQLPTQIHGSPRLQKKIRTLLELYSDCFRSIVSPKPAKIQPLNLNIDEAKWIGSRVNNTRSRTQSAKKNEEIDRHIKLLLDLKVIRESRKIATLKFIWYLNQIISGDFV